MQYIISREHPLARKLWIREQVDHFAGRMGDASAELRRHPNDKAVRARLEEFLVSCRTLARMADQHGVSHPFGGGNRVTPARPTATTRTAAPDRSRQRFERSAVIYLDCRGRRGGKGTGIVIAQDPRSDSIEVLTAAHVVDGCTRIVACFDDSDYTDLHVRDMDTTIDVAVLVGIPERSIVIPQPLARTLPSDGESVVLSGYRDAAIREFHGRWGASYKGQYTVDAPTLRGMSGGPATRGGLTVGIICNGTNTDTYCVDAVRIREWLDGIGKRAPYRKRRALKLDEIRRRGREVAGAL